VCGIGGGKKGGVKIRCGRGQGKGKGSKQGGVKGVAV